MFGNAWLEWGLTLVFAASGTYSLARLFLAFGAIDRAINLCHLAMNGVMLATLWPWGSNLPIALQVAVFTAAALWFLYLILFRPGAQLGPIHEHHRTPLLLWYHAAMMLSMVWMAAVMSLSLAASAGASESSAGASMPGMSMSMPASAGADAAASATALPAPAGDLCFALAILFAAAAMVFIVWAARSLARPRATHARARVFDESANAAMAAGMAIVFVGMS